MGVALWENNLLYLFTQFSLCLLDSRTECIVVVALKTLHFRSFDNNKVKY